MKRMLGIRARTAIVMAGILTFAAFLTMIVIRTLAKTKIETGKYDEIVLRQNQFDEALRDILNRVTLGYLYLFDDPSSLTDYLENDLPTKTEKEAHFAALLAASDIDADTFAEVVIYYDEDFYRGQMSVSPVSYPDTVFLSGMLDRPANTLAYAGNYPDATGQARLVFARQIITMYPESERFAVALFYVKPAAVEAALAALTYPETVAAAFSFLLAANGDIIAASAAGAFLPEYPENGLPTDDFFVVTAGDRQVILIASILDGITQTYPSLVFSTVSVVDRDLLFRDIDRLNQYIILLGAVSLVVLAFLSAQIAGGVARPLNKLIANLKEFGRTKQNVSTVVPEDEIYELEKAYDEMINQIIELIRTNTMEMENKRKLELYALQMQINPHFLYNTLDAIAWMAKIKKEPDIEKLVLALAKFFRISLHKGDKYITIEEEFDLIRNFVAIQTIRFPDMFTVEYCLDPDVKDIETLKLILQPIVENAIKHGFTGLDRIGRIVISAQSAGDDVMFEVADDGIGFLPTDDLFSEKRLLAGLGGYGLKNVDERIKLEYGRDYGISVDSVVAGGTRVFIKIKKTH
ncbi:MAG: sensor histidine kinase [bacterium]